MKTSTASTKKRVNEIIKEDRPVMLDTVAIKLEHTEVQEIIGHLFCGKICQAVITIT
jgi:hypothetical protein